ncbi:conserved exported hypothetical protein [Candidatus Accumulibacter aalborgensis]|uniref:DUF4331 domain-containing protein n=1 Tax=Candidatus Accumulibacter aalborgensis TaxID=1860102 RepID=A0A1A8XW36_9PROT|nr:DUF4331 family protein [Candidatus Accumulibacter aalborgensis]SBT08213.1 conserved exported hypothetical protein [Candidatus Accumulibacter aalborgensis]
MTSIRKNVQRWIPSIAVIALVTMSIAAQASSHREALAVLNEPCADNTDTYAWVEPATHDKLYLIMNFNPLHEPGQGNQGLRACNGYRYQFHIGMGTSIADKFVYRVEFKNTLNPEAAPSPSDPLGGGNELLWQLTGGTETMKVTRIVRSNRPIQLDEIDPTRTTVLGDSIPVLPNNHGPQTDRLVYGLGAFHGYDSGDPSSREVGLYDQNFVDTFIRTLSNGGRVIAGQFDDPYQLDEKGIFDLVNLNRDDLGGIPGARRPPGKDVFTGFNVFSIAIEIPISEIFPDGIPHNGTSTANTTDSLLRVHSTINRQRVQSVDVNNVITGYKGSGDWVQVGRNALPLFNAGLVGTQRQTLYLRSSPDRDVTNFGADILYPVLVRDAEALGIYRALGVPPATVSVLKGPRLDIITAINLGRPIPVADGSTGDVLTLDAAIDSRFPNGRRLGGGTAPNRNQVNVNSVLISLIVAGNPAAGLAKGVEVNDKDYLDRFPFLAPAHQGLLQGHGGINVPTEPDIPAP